MVFFATTGNAATGPLAVVPVLIGPLQVLITVLWYVVPGLLLALAGTVLSLMKPRAMLNLLKALWRLKVQVAVVAACGVGLVWGVGRLWPANGPAAGARQASRADWPLFRGHLTRRGAVPGAVGPSAGGVNWVRKKGEEWFYSSPAVVGNRVYVASALLSAFDTKNGEGRIYCFDADTGAVVWSAEPQFDTGYESYRATFSSPAVRGEYLVCGEGLHYAVGARIVCLDANTGALRWSVPTASHVECSPVIADVTVAGRVEPRVFVGAGDDGYYCLDLKTGATRWHLPGEDFPDAETSLAVHEGKVYAGLGNGGRALCVIDAASGKLLARAATPYAVFSPAAIADGKLYVGMGNGDFVESGSPPAGEVWQVDLARLGAHRGGALAPDWRVRVGGTVLGAVAVADERLYFASADGQVHCVDRRTGRELATFDAHAPVHASPAVAEQLVYVVTETGILYGLDRRTLEVAWEYKVGSAVRCISSPAVAGGKLYVGTQEDGFVCAGRAGQARISVWAGRLGGVEVGGNPFGSPPPTAGEFHWQFPADQQGKTAQAAVAAPPAMAGGNLLVPVARGAKRGLACLPATDSGKTPKPAWFHETPNGVFRSPGVVGDLALCVDGQPGQAGRSLHGLAVADGRGLWRADVAPDAAGAFVAGADDVLILDRPRSVSRYDLAGKRLWARALSGRCNHAPGTSPAMVLVAASDPPALTALDRPTGAVLWTCSLPSPATSSPWVHKARVYVATADGLEARSLLDGSALPAHLWRPTAPGVSGDVVADRSHIAYVSSAGRLVVLDRADGRAAFEPVPGAKAGSCPLLGGDVVLYAAGDGKIMKLAIPTGADGEAAPEPVEWLDASALGEAASPMVLCGSGVYMARTGWGLVRMGEAR